MLIDANRLAARHRSMDYDSEAALARLACADGPRPVVIGQLGQSLDGRIATPSGASKYMNGIEALRHLHRLRAASDAVVIGVGTAIADNPQLTTRLVPGPNPVRVVIDPAGRMPSHLAMLGDGAAPVLVLGRADAPTPAGAERIGLPGDADGHIRPRAIVEALAARGLRRILLEGGAETLARFIDADALDELHLMVAPIVLGSGKTGLNLRPIDRIDEAMRPQVRTMRFRDGDMLLVCDLSDARGEGAVPRPAAALAAG